MELFVMCIGGYHEGAFIELHDMRFVIANKIEDTYESLKNTWWGTPESLHIDAWGALRYVDGYNIKISSEPAQELKNKLYFVNLGGYNGTDFAESHKNVFVVASNPSEARTKAMKQIIHWESAHRDHQFDIDDVIDIAEVSSTKNIYIHLEPADKVQEFEFTCEYIQIG
jgi:hypothetical protein